MPAIHSFKHNGKVVQFQDGDIIEQLSSNEDISHDDFIEAVCGVILDGPGTEVFTVEEFAELEVMPVEKFQAKFEFALTALIKHVYGM